MPGRQDSTELAPGRANAPASPSPAPAPAASSPGRAPEPAANPLPTVALPAGGGAIRPIGEKFAANAATGTGAMTVPLPTSAGRSGLDPKLSLSYDSGRGNGPFGFGWTLSTPAVTRKTDTGLPRYDDAHESDEFVLTDAEDLVPARDAGAGWARARVVDPPYAPGFRIDRYRPRVEGAFARIERWTRLADGDTHWRAVTPHNVTTEYGADAASRIADPADPSRVFSWLISRTYDDKGNALEYEYVAEDGRGVDTGAAHERNRDAALRGTARYLKRLRYGNRVSRLADPTLAAADWMFEVVFDYGDHDAAAPTPAPTTAWPVREHPFSAYRAGFEVRSYRLCRRVLMFHHFPDEAGVGAGCLVRSVELRYGAGDAVGEFLTEVVQHGHRRVGGGYVTRSLPPLELGYSRVEFDDTVHELDPAALAGAPAGLGGGTQWVDLDGEGVSGMLAEHTGGWYYKANLGGGGFAPPRLVAALPTTTQPAGATQLLDLAGDGRLDVVSFGGGLPGFFERTDRDGFQHFVPFHSLPWVDWSDPNLRFVDLDGDGLADVLVTESDAVTWYPAYGERGFGQAQRQPIALDEERGPRAVFADGTQSLHLADMSGDGLVDLVRVRSGEVCYWPNLGHGRFGAKVTMDGAPALDHAEAFDATRVRLADLDGSGLADLVYAGAKGMRIWRNRSGNSWTPAYDVATAPRLDPFTEFAVVDLFGAGTPCLVWSSVHPADARRSVRYIDLLSSRKPHLLTRVANNLGGETHVHYAPSTRFYLADRAAGRPWLTRLPFPVQVVERVETHDLVSRTRFVSRYAYHHGYFDGDDREFRGFGMVEQWDTEEIAAIGGEPAFDNEDPVTHVPPVLRRSWFHTGAFLAAGTLGRQYESEYWREPGRSDAAARLLLVDDTVWPDGLLAPDGTRTARVPTTEELVEASRALKGSALREEVYALDGTAAASLPYLVSERSYGVELLQPRQDGDRHAVCMVTPRETVTLNYERSRYDVPQPDGTVAQLPDPRVTHELVLDVDGFGNVLRAVTVGYGRRHAATTDPALPGWARDAVHAEQARARALAVVSTYTNAVDQGLDHRAPVMCESRRYELVRLPAPARGAGALYRIDEVRAFTDQAADGAHDLAHEDFGGTGAAGPGTFRRLVERGRTLFRRDDMTGPLAHGVLEPLALPFESYRLVLTPALTAQVYRRTVGGVEENLLPDPAAVLGEAGYVGDAAGWWLPSGRIAYSPDPTHTAAQERAFARAHYFLPHRVQDPFGNVVTVTYDRYDLLAAESRDAFGNRVTVGVRNSAGTVVERGHDYRVLETRLLTDPNGNSSAVAFDTLGLVVATAVTGKPGEALGDSLAGLETDLPAATVAACMSDPIGNSRAVLGDATTRIVYDREAYLRTRADARPQPTAVLTIARETHVSDLPAGGTSRLVHDFSYADGLGRDVQRKTQSAPGPLQPGGPEVADRWVASAWRVFDNKGRPVREYEPFFTDRHQAELGHPAGISPVLLHDPVGRLVATLRPDGSYRKVVTDAWAHQSWDGNDTTLLDPGTDPDVAGFTAGFLAARAAAGQPWRTWHARNAGGANGAAGQRAAEQTARHAATPTTVYADPLGRAFLTVAHNRVQGAGGAVDELHPTLWDVDIQGFQRRVRDPLGRTALRQDFDLLGRPIRQVSADGGQTANLLAVDGSVCRSWDARGHATRKVYDALRRQTRCYVRVGAGAERLVHRTGYGESHPEAAQRNLRTRALFHLDGAGQVTIDRYDYKGNPASTVRRLAAAYRETPDWSALDGTADATLASTPPDAQLTPDRFTRAVTYDALDRPALVVASVRGAAGPPRSVNRVRNRYDAGGLLFSVEVNQHPDDLGPAQWQPVVSGIEYDPRGQRTVVRWGNGAVSRSGYDPDTLRLVALATRRPAAAFPDDCPDPAAVPCGVQNLTYTYDPEGNVVQVRDDAQQRVFYANAVAEPHQDYTYDALYRLVEARGREHRGQPAQLQPTRTDVARARQPHPHDGQAMRAYVERYSYDAAGNLLEIVHQAPGGSWTQAFTYDTPSAAAPGEVGNRLSRVAVGGGAPDTYEHDANGNLTRMPELAALTWDHAGQLHSAALSGNRTVFFAYDASGQRVRKVIERQDGSRVLEWTYTGALDVYREFDQPGTGTSLERHTLQVNDDRRRVALVETRVAGNGPEPVRLVRWSLDNYLGSSHLELDDAARVISYEETYPYGATSYQAVRSQTETPKRFRHSGKERDEETGLYYYGARYYAPWLCRWTSCDPSIRVDELSRYAYCRNSPTVYADPDGKEARVIVDPTAHTLTVQTTVHLYAATASQRTHLETIARQAEAFWANPTVADQAAVTGAINATPPTAIPNAGLTAPVGGTTWTLRFDIRYVVHTSPTAPISVAAGGPGGQTTLYDVDNARATADGFAVGDNVLTFRSTTGAGAGGVVEHATIGTLKSNMVGEIRGNVSGAIGRAALYRRLLHETGHAIGLDDRYDPVTAQFFQGGYPGFDYDIMGSDTGYATRVIDPRHVRDFLTYGAALAATIPATATGAQTFLQSGHIDDTRDGTLKPSDAGYAAAQTAANAAAVTRTGANTRAWQRAVASPTGTATDLIPHLPRSVINSVGAAPPTPTPTQKKQAPVPVP